MAAKAPRRQERIFAFKVLYGLCFTASSTKSFAEVKGPSTVAITALENAFMQSPDKPENQTSCQGFAWDLVYGVWQNQEAIDLALSRLSDNWRVERMGKVELTLLRLALFELSNRDEGVPPKVVLNEAVELSKQFGDDKSRSFVNGILDAAARALEKGNLL